MVIILSLIFCNQPLYALLISVTNLLYQVFTNINLPTTTTNIKNDEQNANLASDTIKELYNNLNVERTQKIKYKRKIQNLQNMRKKNQHRTSDPDSSSDEEILVAATIPSEISNKAKFTLKGIVGHDTQLAQDITWEIDTGSVTSLISKKTYENIDKALILNERPVNKTCTDFSGNEIKFLKEIQIQILFDNFLVTHFFRVTQQEEATNLIGIDLIRSKRMSIHVNQECNVYVTFNSSDTLPKRKVAIEENKTYPLYATSTTEIDGNTTNFISTNLFPDTIHLVNSNDLYNIIGVTNLNLPHHSNDQMLSQISQDGLIEIPIQNHNFSSSTIFEGQQIGTFKPLSEGTEIYNPKSKIYDVIDSNHKIKPNMENMYRTLNDRINPDPTLIKTDTINKIKLSNNTDSESPVMSESDMGEDIFKKIRIPDSSKIWKEVLADVPDHLQKRVFHLLTTRFENVVSKFSTDFGCCSLQDSEFSIDLEDNTPIFCKPYALNRVYEEQLKEIITDMVNSKLLVPESSNYSTGVFIRPRPDATNTNNHRIRCISDYRSLNAKTIRDLFPLPNINMILQKLNKKKFFILLDLKDSYQAIKIKESDRYKASLITSFGQFTPTRLGYGFKNAPSFFSRQIYRVIHDIPDCFNYLDDICCVGNTAEECLDIFEKVIERLDFYGFRISLTKLNIFKRNMKILGVIINRDGIRSDPAKVKCVLDFPIPTTKLEVQRFLGTANFLSDFVPNFSLISSSLYKLTKSTTDKITLDKEQIEAFNNLKEAISKPTILSFVDNTKPIYLETDAANGGYGAYGYQVYEYNEEDIPQLKNEYENTLSKSPEELNKELTNIIECYTTGKNVPSYTPFQQPSKDTQTNEDFFSPFLNTKIKIKKVNKKIYVPKICFFASKKFTDSQKRGWSSLMKELTAIIDITEKRIDILSLAQEIIVLTDCQAATYLWHQSKSNSIMARYLSRLNNYNIKMLVRHKPGPQMTIADALSRVYTVDSDESTNEKVHHRQGILVKVPFRLGSIITPDDIIEYIEKSPDQIVTSTSDEKITKCCQTDAVLIKSCEEEIENTNNHLGQINNIKSKVLQEMNNSINADAYVEAQKKELPSLYNTLLTSHKENYKLENGIILIRKGKEYIRLTPPSLRNIIMSHCHLMGHKAGNKMKEVIERTDTWENIRKDCIEFASTCLSCTWIRPPRGSHFRLGVPLTGKSGEILMLDTVSGLNDVEGKKFFISVIDTFSRFLVTFPLRSDTAEEICKNLEDRVFSVFPCPKYIISDGAQNLGKSKRFQDLCNLYKVQIKIRSPYSSRSTGAVERVHRTVLDNIRSLNDSFNNNWLSNLALATCIYNSTPHTATTLSPFEIRFGYANNLFNPITENDSLLPRDVDLHNYRKEIQKQIQTAYNTAQARDKEYKDNMRKRFGGVEIPYPPGCFVLTQDKRPAKNEKKKLRPKFYGPFLVHEELQTVVIAENCLNGKTTHLNKNLLRKIPTKSVLKYSNLPLYAKKIFGEGFDYESWQTLYHEGKLIEKIKNRDFGDVEFGIEHPILPEMTNTTATIPEEEFIKPPTDSETDSSENEQNEIVQPTQNSNTPTQSKTVSFKDQEPPRKSSRTTKPVIKLNL